MGRVLLATALAVAATPLAASTTTAAEDDPGTQGRLVLVLDSSGSMKEPSRGGVSRIEAAQAAVTDVVERLPDDAEVGLRVFGATVEDRGDAGACTDSQAVVPVGPLDRAAVTAAVGRYRPYGETPIGHALRAAADDLGPDGRRRIVLLSDGEPTCAPDPCEVARELRDRDVALTVDVVGLHVSGRARRVLQCVAEAGGGTYHGVDDPDRLASSLVSASVRAVRPFRLTGEPVTGGVSAVDALSLRPGRYTDRTVGGGAARHYVVDKPAGGGVTVSALARPADDGGLADLVVELRTPDDVHRCAVDDDLRGHAFRARGILAAAASSSPHGSAASRECADATRLLASVTSDRERPEPFELVVSQTPPFEDVASLPAPVGDDEHRALGREPFPDVPGAPTPVAGGTSFAQAPALAPGRYADTLRPGEQLLYRVPAGWGQRVRARVTLEADPVAADELSGPGVAVETETFSPTLHRLGYAGPGGGGFYDGVDDHVMTAESYPRRLRNVESGDGDVRSMATDGAEYLAVSMAGTLDGDGSRFAAPVVVEVVVDGEVSGVPRTAEPPAARPADGSPGAGAEASEGDDGAGVPWWPLGAGVVVVGALVAGGVLVARRRAGLPTSHGDA